MVFSKIKRKVGDEKCRVSREEEEEEMSVRRGNR